MNAAVLQRLVIFGLLSLAFTAAQAIAENGLREPHPYGGYCKDRRWGWYGANTPVKTAEEARKYLERYFDGQDAIVGTIVDKGIFFRAEITDARKKVIDRVIVDKRTGRIRTLN